MDGQPQNPGNNAGLIAFVAITGLIIASWYLAHDKVMYGWLTFSQILLYPLTLLAKTGLIDVSQLQTDIKIGKEYVELLGIKTIWKMGNQIAWYYFIIFLVPLLLLFRLAIIHPGRRLLRKMDFETLLHYQAQVWSVIKPVLHLDLIKTKPKPGVGWGASLRVDEYLNKYGLINDRQLDLVKTEKLLLASLGKTLKENKWQEYEKALFVVFGYRIMRTRVKTGALKGQDLLYKLADSTIGYKRTWYGGTTAFNQEPDYAIASKDFDYVWKQKDVQKIIKGHRYIRTALMMMLVEARRYDGKLAVNDFLWLRPVDRTLWYALQRAPVDQDKSVHPCFVEGAGVASTWQFEYETKVGGMVIVNRSCVLSALTAMIIELEQAGYIDVPIHTTDEDGTIKILSERDMFDDVLNRLVIPALKKKLN